MDWWYIELLWWSQITFSKKWAPLAKYLDIWQVLCFLDDKQVYLLLIIWYQLKLTVTLDTVECNSSIFMTTKA